MCVHDHGFPLELRVIRTHLFVVSEHPGFVFVGRIVTVADREQLMADELLVDGWLLIRVTVVLRFFSVVVVRWVLTLRFTLEHGNT